MKGSIGTKQRCKECKGTFSDRDKHGFKCPKCGTRPTTYIVRAKAFGIKNPLYRTPEGELLSHISLAEGLLASIRSKWTDCKDKSKFNPDDFIAKKVVLQKIDEKIKSLLAEKDDLYLREKPKLSKGRWQAHYNLCNNFILPHFKEMDIRTIDKAEIKRFWKKILALKMKDGTNYSDKFLKEIMSELGSIFIHSDLPIPEFPKEWNDIEPKLEKNRLSFDDQMKVAPFIPERHGYKLAMNIFNYAPMRPCELKALSVGDITERGVLVWKSLTDRLKLVRKDKGKPKPYILPDYVMDDLRKHVEGKDRDDFIFTIDGNPYGNGALSKMWKRAIKKSGIPKISFYQAIRHSWASQEWDDAHEDALGRIQSKLAHSNRNTGRKHYIV